MEEKDLIIEERKEITKLCAILEERLLYMRKRRDELDKLIGEENG